MTYTIEGWSGLDAVGFRSVQRPTTVVTHTEHLILDRGADRVTVRRDGEIVAECNGALVWQRVKDQAIERIVTEGAR